MARLCQYYGKVKPIALTIENIADSCKIVNMFKEFFLKQMLKKKGVPAEQIDPILDVIKNNPELFQKIATEIEEKSKNGHKDQMAVAMEVMQKYQSELQKVFRSSSS